MISLPAGDDLESRLHETLATAHPGTVVELPEGKYSFQDEIIIDKAHVVLRGQGASRTVLSFARQTAGAQGILISQPGAVLEDFAVEDTPGDSIKAAGVNGVTFRRLRVEWTGGPSQSNGGYGLYPVSSRNVLIEDCEVIGASDSGVYVGQSENIVVRRNNPHGNVGGIEIENSRFADVYDNRVHDNAAGILVFDLPELPKQGGKQTRVFDNLVQHNSGPNFSVNGNILHVVPSGVGILVVANSDDEVFRNRIEDQGLVSIAVMHFAVTQRPYDDPNYHPRPERISIHDNVIQQHFFSFFDGNQMNFLANILFFFHVPEIVYDGIEDGTYTGTPLADDQRICLSGNVEEGGGEASFGNMHLDHQRWYLPWPGGPVSRDPSPHRCEHPSLPAVALDEPTPLPPPAPEIPPEVVQALCSAPGEGVNWPALAVNCPSLSDYRLFADPQDPTIDPSEGGVPYDLSTPLFSDYAVKDRFVFLPPGTSAKYQASGAFDFPVGTVISKTFSFLRDIDDPSQGKRIVETRLLIHRPEGWTPLPYLWGKDGTARLAPGGRVKTITWTDHSDGLRRIRYNVPGQSKCQFCHSGSGNLGPIGLKAKFLNKLFAYPGGFQQNQIEHWLKAGILSDVPSPEAWPRVPTWNDPRSGTLEARAKGYLEINCAHCHNPVGLARNTGFYLEFERDSDSSAYGTCKAPVAAGQGSGGRLFDVVPGKPDESILLYRLSSQHLSIRMPEEGRSVVHEEGLKLIRNWVASRPYKKCR